MQKNLGSRSASAIITGRSGTEVWGNYLQPTASSGKIDTQDPHLGESTRIISWQIMDGKLWSTMDRHHGRVLRIGCEYRQRGTIRTGSRLSVYAHIAKEDRS
jgi:hypothetical protein